MFSFLRVAEVMVSLHNNNPKTEASPRDQGIAEIGQTMLLFRGMQTLGCQIMKAVKCFKCYSIGRIISSMEDSGPKGNLNCGGPAQDVSEKNFNMWP